MWIMERYPVRYDWTRHEPDAGVPWCAGCYSCKHGFWISGAEDAEPHGRRECSCWVRPEFFEQWWKFDDGFIPGYPVIAERPFTVDGTHWSIARHAIRILDES